MLCCKQRVGKLPRSLPLSKVLLEHSHTHHLHVILAASELQQQSSAVTTDRAHKAKGIYYLVPYRSSSPI